jgi:catechol 2,3-dioxygenase-like lactoylglutathione lyase family enzyme
MLPCGDIDEMAAFWTSLGLAVTYRQVRPNPYLALGRNAIDLHYYGMDQVDPEQSHSTCAIASSPTRRRSTPCSSRACGTGTAGFR